MKEVEGEKRWKDENINAKRWKILKGKEKSKRINMMRKLKKMKDGKEEKLKDAKSKLL